MFAYIKRSIAIIKSGQEAIVLRQRLFAYLALMALVLLGCAVLMLFMLSKNAPEGDTPFILHESMQDYREQITASLSDIAAQGIQLSSQVGKEVERTLAEQGASFAALNDNPRLINQLERNMYNLAHTGLIMANASGVFIIIDATVNSSVPGSENSRSGLYLKLANISASKPVNPYILWMRGAHQVALENKLALHSKWQLEFAIEHFPFYHIVMQNASQNLLEHYYYSQAMPVHNTWERAIFLAVPIVGKNGQVYGVCGFEISDAWFKLIYQFNVGQNKRLTGLLAPLDKDLIMAEQGLETGAKSGYFAGLSETTVRAQPAADMHLFHASDGREFVGFYKQISLSPLNGSPSWAAACFMPKADYESATSYNYTKILIYCLIFIGIALLLCWYINRRCITPMLNGIAAIKSGAASKTNIVEIDDLLEFLAQNDAEAEMVDVSAFHEFKANIQKLSKAEKAVFDLYLQGLSAPEIADKLFVSINTIKTHNKNIYRKLHISSHKELKVYAQMMKGA